MHKKQLEKHIERDNYFGTIATVLNMARQTLEKDMREPKEKLAHQTPAKLGRRFNVLAGELQDRQKITKTRLRVFVWIGWSLGNWHKARRQE